MIVCFCFQKGEYGIPTALVSRYAQESRSSEEELVKAIDSIRRTELIKNRRSHVSITILHG